MSLIDARTLRARSRFRAVPDGPVAASAYVPDGRLLVVGGDDGSSRSSTRRRAGRPAAAGPARPAATRPSFSADGRLMATAAPATRPAVDAAAGAGGPPATILSAGRACTACRSAPTADAGRRVGAGVEIVDVATLRRARGCPAPSSRVRVQLHARRPLPRRRQLEGWARLWSTDHVAARYAASWRPHRRGDRRRPSARTAARWPPAAPTARSGCSTCATQQPIGAPLPGVPNRPVAPLFTPDGAYLFGITDAGRAYRWDVRPSSWARHACAIAGRRLTRAEWNDVLPGRDYAPAC